MDAVEVGVVVEIGVVVVGVVVGVDTRRVPCTRDKG